ncbi:MULTISPECIES: MBL fold metallo-hydrolase [Rhizobium]|uniref:Glyoxylase-like metal-dependent hydrolase (Beta-lactamase superfamily II) n=1 Tax=Rhizobium esperanzae TaxID=1967781 RepID=A0A7W6UHM4_9HYPH|nr:MULTISPECIES: MBL fold metallo-hydrolase [Rhizobium]MBB4438221.1 glyoxylase-like metal-dependent hydrolase (beta-lactamase superfamily II) [Rhizobium esperanzae]MDH6201041.1 glyoxylase-like metal-dependent hydrolase (beta-lactamase superfamily II) [Rhizobium leguminosarum]
MAKNNSSLPLKWDVFIRRRESATQGVPSGRDDLKWVSNAVTLIYGDSDAVLVDTLLSDQQNSELGDWIEARQKTLRWIYITHAHPDHFFGLALLLERFPTARAIALPQVVALMHKIITPEFVAENWEKRFPGQIPERLVAAEEFGSNGFELEGVKLVPIHVGHTDTDHTTSLFVPSIGLVVAGDAAYNDTHPYLGESDHAGRLEWIAAIDKIAALQPRHVVVGHGPLDPDHAAAHLVATRKYIEAFDRLDSQTATAQELYDHMIELYPDRINPGSLWGAAHAAKAFLARNPA